MNRAERRALRRAKPPPRGAGHIKLPINIRFEQKHETDFQLLPHLCLSKFRDGTADSADVNTLAVRLNLGRVLAEAHFGADVAEPLRQAQKALHAVKERHARTGAWGTTAQEHAAMGAVLNSTDAMQLQCSRRDLRDAIEAVYGANEYRRQMQGIADRLDGRVPAPSS